MIESTYWKIYHGDALQVLAGMPDKSIDLVFTSPPYEDARTYGIGFALSGQDWVDWVVKYFHECLRVSRGLVAFVVAGRTDKFRWTATPALMMADLHRAGVKLRTPPIYERVGIPGSGGPDWLRNDYESIVCATHGKLPWSDNTAMGHAPKCHRRPCCLCCLVLQLQCCCCVALRCHRCCSWHAYQLFVFCGATWTHQQRR